MIGIAATIIVQSSSIVTSILVLFGQHSLITLEAGLPLILGANIGATIIPFLFSLGGGVNAKRAGISNVFFKVITVILVFPFLNYYISFIKHSTTNIAQQIVNSHFFFSILVACLFIFLIKPFAKLLEKIIPSLRYKEFNLALLDFGAVICKSNKPNCGQCVLNKKCKYFLAGCKLQKFFCTF